MTEFNNMWFQFLAQHGARFADSSTPDISGFENETDSGTESFLSPLPSLGLIAVSGEEAARFLHSQLTNDIEHLGTGEARLAGYCSPKGRLLATMLAWGSNDAIYLQLPRQILPAIQKRLQMFVLRSKAKLADVSDRHAILGLSGRQTGQILARWFPALPAAPYQKMDSAAGTLLRVSDAEGIPRYQWIAETGMAQQAWPELSAALPVRGSHVWRLTDIRAGIPQITEATQERFVPQMINFEAIGGVSFRKGCYPGQEIVARSQYLGKLKRRMMSASVATRQITAGMEVFSSTDPAQPCGMIVNAECNAAGQSECLVEIKTSALESGTVHLGSADGPLLEFRTLPYPLPDNG